MMLMFSVLNGCTISGGEPHKVVKNNRCGDGICSPAEKGGASKCPIDCRDKTPTTVPTPSPSPTPEQTPTPSPPPSSPLPIGSRYFGAHGETMDTGLTDSEFFSELGNLDIQYKRNAGPWALIWGKVDKELDEVYSWTYFDNLVDLANTNDIDLMITIKSINNNDRAKCGSANPCDWDKYSRFLATAINRYNNIKYWQIENEVSGKYYTGTASDYAELLSISYDVIKDNCPDCSVLIAGMPDYQPMSALFYNDILSGLEQTPSCEGSGCFDIFDLHTPMRGGYESVASRYNQVLIMLNKYGFIDKPIWSSEYGPLSYADTEDDKIEYEIAKFYAVGFDLGFKKLFWRVSECPSCIIDNKVKTNNYYAYKTVIDKLDGFTSVKKLTDGQYMFSFRSKDPVFVLWCATHGCEKHSAITGIITVTDYLGNQQTMDASDLVLSSAPVFVE